MFKKHFQILFLFLLLSFTAGGCATAPKRPLVSVHREAYLKDVCARGGVRWRWDPVSQVVTLDHKGEKAEMLVGSDLVLVGKERITLSAPVRTVRSAVIVPPDFQSEVIDRLHRRAVPGKRYGPLKIRGIVIDAGHGGKDPGAIGHDSVQEKMIVMDISRRLKEILQRNGFRVKMTREKDEFISLEERTQIASRDGADLFVSIHANSSPARSVYGLEVFTAEDLKFEERNGDQRKTNQRLMFNNLSIKKGAFDVERIVSDMLYTHKQSEAAALARQVAQQTAREAGTKNRGPKEARFYVLRNTLVPAILVEVGFLTNPKEAELLQTSVYRQRLARGLAESITDYANGK